MMLYPLVVASLMRKTAAHFCAGCSSVVNLKSAIVWTQFGGNICPLMEVDDGATSSGIGVDGIGA